MGFVYCLRGIAFDLKKDANSFWKHLKFISFVHKIKKCCGEF